MPRSNKDFTGQWVRINEGTVPDWLAGKEAQVRRMTPGGNLIVYIEQEGHYFYGLNEVTYDIR